ncbi:DNA ligase 4, partial [Bienertia sinuspersici]
MCLKPRSGYFRGKGTALRGYSKGGSRAKNQGVYKKLKKKLQTITRGSGKNIKTTRTTRQDMQRSMEEMKQQLLSELIANRMVRDKRAATGWNLEQKRPPGNHYSMAGVGRAAWGCRGSVREGGRGREGLLAGAGGLQGWGAGAIGDCLMQGKGGAIRVGVGAVFWQWLAGGSLFL